MQGCLNWSPILAISPSKITVITRAIKQYWTKCIIFLQLWQKKEKNFTPSTLHYIHDKSSNFGKRQFSSPFPKFAIVAITLSCIYSSYWVGYSLFNLFLAVSSSLSIYHLSIYLPTYLPVYHLSIYLSIYLSIHLAS